MAAAVQLQAAHLTAKPKAVAPVDVNAEPTLELKDLRNGQNETEKNERESASKSECHSMPDRVGLMEALPSKKRRNHVGVMAPATPALRSYLQQPVIDETFDVPLCLSVDPTCLRKSATALTARW